MSKNPQTLRLFIKYIVGEATFEEKQKVEQWLKKDAANQQLLRSLEQLLHESQLDLARWNEDELWNKFASKAGLALSQAQSPDEVRKIRQEHYPMADFISNAMVLWYREIIISVRLSTCNNLSIDPGWHGWDNSLFQAASTEKRVSIPIDISGILYAKRGEIHTFAQ